MKITDEMIEAAARTMFRQVSPTHSWAAQGGYEKYPWLEDARAVLEAALAVAPEPVKVLLYRSSEIREAVNVLDQLNAEGRVDDFAYDEMRSAIEGIHDCESATAVPHEEHIDRSELIAEADKAYEDVFNVAQRERDLIRRLADALEGVAR